MGASQILQLLESDKGSNMIRAYITITMERNLMRRVVKVTVTLILKKTVTGRAKII